MKKLKRLVLSVIIAILVILTVGNINTVNASESELYLGIVSLRSSGYGYKQAGKKVWKIAEYESFDDITADLSRTIYCIKAGPGFGSTDMATGGVQKISKYTEPFDLRNPSAIPAPYNAVLQTGANYNKLLWVLDNLYIMPKIGTDNTTAREAFLASKIPNEAYYLLTDDDIDVVQQLAIWYFTNPIGDYHYNSIELSINSTVNDDSSAYKVFEDLYGDDGWDRQDAASALYEYYINNAPADYTSTVTTEKPIELKTSTAQMQTIGSNYVAGPYQINELLEKDYTITATYTDTEDKPITPTIGVKDANGNIVATSKTLKELVDTEFYLMVPTSSGISGINMIINSSYTARTITYWSVKDAPESEQPVVIVEEKPLNFFDPASIVVPKPFDLSLRKFITEVNGVAVDSREPEVDVSKLKAGASTTAIYEHSKTPIKVAIGDVVTYTIRVYNEGSVDGYVEEITDHLPANLELIVDDATNIKYGWKFASSSDFKTVKTTYLSNANEITEGENKIEAFDGTDLDYRDVQIKCKVISTTPMANKITNIADITKFTDGDGKTVTDRDSQENNATIPTGTELENYKDAEINRGETYIPGQQDDDDFEKLTLKEFDLALRKFITGVNDEDITSRIPSPDLTALKAGPTTTATYNHTKTPIKVTIGDTVIYTIRVYNEGEVDGYVEEITDHLPDQLEFLPENSINQEYKWKMYDAEGKETTDVNAAVTIKTTYLSKANETTEANKIAAFNGTTLSYKEVKVACKVTQTNPMPSKITNIADITKFTDGNGNVVTDRDSQENNVTIPSDLPGYKDDEISKSYVPGQQDDDDFEKLMIKGFDLSLRKFITEVNDEDITTRIPSIDVSALKAGTTTTATYNHTKTPVPVAIGDTVVYTIRVYNEGDVDGYVEKIKDHLPNQLKYLPNHEINKKYGWETVDGKTITTDYLSKANEATEGANKIVAFDGQALAYKEVKVACEVVWTEPMPSKITNIADIAEFTNGNGESVTDRDSQGDNVTIPSDLPGYKDSEITKSYVPGQQDDDDFEKLVLKEFDLALRKFITRVNNEEITSRIPQVDTTPLKNGLGTTAIYNHSKEPVKVTIGSTVIYTIRAYNEGDVDGYAEEITDHLPNQLEFLPDHEINKKYGWEQVDDKKITTNYLSKENETSEGANKIAAFDGATLAYKEVKVACKVVWADPMPSKITNIADITDAADGSGANVPDRDSQEDNVQIPEDPSSYKDDEMDKDYVPGQQDDDDFEKVEIVEFDLALRKFITAVNSTEIKSRIPQVDVTPLKDGTGETAIYNHSKEPVLVSNGNIVTYTIRVFNEGEVDGYAKQIKDDIPEGLEFLPENDTNVEYRWKLLDEEGNETTDNSKAVSIVTDYLSKEQEETNGENLLEAFESQTMDSLSYKDVKVAFKVVEPATSDRIVINQAQVSEDSDKDGNDVEDRDSTPDVWNEGEDDQDIEKIKVQYFDLSLRKWVTQAIVIEGENKTVTETGHKAEDDPEAIAKVDLKKSKIDKVTVKFRYKIRVTNEGKIAGYVKELKDYIPNGLKFVAEDNPLWTQVGDKTITTDQTKNILLQPGESTEVEVLLTWINDEENMGVMDNWAEISKDYNEFGSPDIDSTPDNNKQGEDDIDNAPVMVTIQTGQISTYTTITLAALAIILAGVILIKKFVL